jgi:phosphopantothenoylcysteine synthetase/decarboxylase
MYMETIKRFANADVVIGAAAVADWRPASYSRKKIKKCLSAPAIRLIANPDILKKLGKLKKHQVMVGFALETHNLIKSAGKKLKEKHLDMIVANTPSSIGNNSSQAILIDSEGKTTALRGAKSTIAKRILNAIHKKARHI